MGELTHQVRREGDSIQLTLDGEVDMRVASRLREILHEILEESPPVLVVDLAAVPFVDSSGVATLVEALRLQMNASRSLRIVNASESVYYTFKITQLTKAFGMEEPEEQTS